MICNDTWRDVAGYEGLYKVNSSGIIVAYERVRFSGGVFRRYKEKILNQCVNSAGYKVVDLTKNGITSTKSMHRILATAFKPVPDMDKMVINHIDFNRQNNDLDNLEWCTQKYNVNHTKQNGRLNTARGEKQGRSKFNDSDVPNIVRLYNSGMKQIEIAKMYGVHKSTISEIVTRKTYAHVSLR